MQRNDCVACMLHLINVLLLAVNEHHTGNEAGNVGHQQASNDQHSVPVEAGASLPAAIHKKQRQQQQQQQREVRTSSNTSIFSSKR